MLDGKQPLAYLLDRKPTVALLDDETVHQLREATKFPLCYKLNLKVL
jgi:hypothetical protein